MMLGNEYESILRAATKAEEQQDDLPKLKIEDTLLSEEIETLIRGQHEAKKELTQLKNQRRRIKMQRMRLDVRMRSSFGKSVFKYLCYFSSFCAVILLLQGFNPKADFHINLLNIRIRLGGFHLDDTPITTLIGSTAVSAIGLVAIVLRGLFRSPPEDSKKEKGGEKS